MSYGNSLVRVKASWYVFSLFPTYPNDNIFKQIIFSEESYDFNKALLFKSKRKLSGHRLYKKIECSEDFTSKVKDNKIVFFSPSRSKKSDKLERNQIIKETYEKFLFYDYYKNKIVIFNDNDKKLNLNTLISCN